LLSWQKRIFYRSLQFWSPHFAVAMFCVNVPLISGLLFTESQRKLMLAIVLVILVVIGVVLIGMYNTLVQLRVRCDSAWSDIDVQLKRRHDLIPNLVETVKGYAAHEKGTFENVAKFRSQAMQAATPADRAAAENQLTGALKSLFAVAENYPELKASEEFSQLQGSLSQTEDQIQNARRYYNAVVRDLNTKLQSFPTNLLAGMFGFAQRQFFETAELDREPVEVKF
jgi:LemA protein